MRHTDRADVYIVIGIPNVSLRDDYRVYETEID